MKYYFYFDGLSYDRNKISNLIDFENLKWDTYGPPSKRTLFVNTLQFDDQCISDIIRQFKPGVVEDAMILMTKRQGMVAPHKDTRPTSLLLPLKGNFKDSSVNFYENIISEKEISIQGNNFETRPSAKSYTVGEPDLTLSYDRPICIDTHIVHAVKNPCDEDRYVFSISLRRDLTLNNLYEEYKTGNILV